MAFFLLKLRMNLAFLLLLLISGFFCFTFEAQACGANAVLLQNPDDDLTSGRSEREKRGASRGGGGHFGFPMGDEAPPSMDVEIQAKVDPGEDFEFKWCVDSWVNNSRNVITAIFNRDHTPRLCSEFCMVRWDTNCKMLSSRTR